jgi:poly-gamma-glutamate synthesis protein (capsule biosynthesis protein)
MGNILIKNFIILNIINVAIKLIKCFNKSSSEDISICMVGDLLIHLPILDYAKTEGYNFDFIFENMEKYIKEYDIKIINEEVLIAGTNFSIKGYPKFNSPLELADSVAKAGFNVILKSTNHVNDLGEEARLFDLNNWKKFPNIKVTGSYQNEEEAQKITYFEIKGIKIALLNYCYGSNRLLRNSYTINKINYDKIKNDINKSKSEGADIIIVMPHWGKEYSLKTNKFQNKWSKIFFELGVDIVIGTHPHVIQPVEIIEDKDKNRKMYIFYSLGNFINSTSSRKKNVFWRFLGGMAHIIIGKVNNKPVIKNIKFIPLITHINPENKKVTTFKVKDYSENMAKNNYVGIEYDKTFTYNNMIDVFKNTIDKDFLDFNL